MTLLAIVLLFLNLSGLTVQRPAQPSPLLSRRYEEGAKVVYQMHGENDGSTYAIRLHSVVKKSADGRFVEEYSWSDGVSNGEPRPLAAASEGFRATVWISGLLASSPRIGKSDDTPTATTLRS